MKKTILIALATLILAGGAFAQLNLKLEGAGHLAISDGENAFSIDGCGILHMNDMFAFRAQAFMLEFDPMKFYLGTGLIVDGLIFFEVPANITPYGILGLHLFLEDNYNQMLLNFGGGSEFGSGALRPFAELIVRILSVSWSGHSDSANSVSIRGGVRFDLGF
ncbi:MAG TPA: hypothetical protein ENN07_01990 [candidate division Zixibacteria bacterium]|nr:hypothetical protein [candidate division Zixibacteria bacterium]